MHKALGEPLVVAWLPLPKNIHFEAGATAEGLDGG